MLPPPKGEAQSELLAFRWHARFRFTLRCPSSYISRSIPSTLCGTLAARVEGFSNREIAHKLGLTEHTVGDHLIRIYEKLGITSRVELVLCSPRVT
jgi:DNA-binding NarL/FixJ family response regulator